MYQGDGATLFDAVRTKTTELRQYSHSKVKQQFPTLHQLFKKLPDQPYFVHPHRDACLDTKRHSPLSG
jgi:hypothetical protein